MGTKENTGGYGWAPWRWDEAWKGEAAWEYGLGGKEHTAGAVRWAPWRWEGSMHLLFAFPAQHREPSEKLLELDLPVAVLVKAVEEPLSVEAGQAGGAGRGCRNSCFSLMFSP